MNLRLSAIAAALACAGALCSAAPASAASLKLDLPTEARTAVQSDVTLVGSRRGFYRYNGHAYYNGHRGFRHHRRGYHRHSGYWFPRAAFVFSFTVRPRTYDRYYGVAPQRTPPRAKVIGLNHSHYRWCDAKYRSYRSYDNTFQPYHGPRKQCVSPYY